VFPLRHYADGSNRREWGKKAGNIELSKFEAGLHLLQVAENQGVQGCFAADKQAGSQVFEQG